MTNLIMEMIQYGDIFTEYPVFIEEKTGKTKNLRNTYVSRHFLAGKMYFSIIFRHIENTVQHI